MTLSTLLSAGTVYLLTLMGAFPFAIWSGRAVHAGMVAAPKGETPVRPGRAATIFCVVMPLVVFAWYLWSSVGTPMAAAPGAFDPMADEPEEGVQAMFFLLPPCLGLIAGYLGGWFLGARRRDVRNSAEP
jgi:hypothetical protein